MKDGVCKPCDVACLGCTDLGDYKCINCANNYKLVVLTG